MNDSNWQVYPPWLGRWLAGAGRYVAFAGGCLVLSCVVHVLIMFLGPVGLMVCEPVTGGHPLGWPLVCAEAGLEGDHTLWVPFLLDVLFYAAILTPGCYLLVRKSLRFQDQGEHEAES